MHATFAPGEDQAELIRLKSVFDLQKSSFFANPFPSELERRTNLSRVRLALKSNMDLICDAISQDFGHRSRDETRLLEFFPNLSLISYYEKHLRKWMRPQKRHVSIWFKPAHNYIVPQPLGVVGIIVPWNYPLFLALGPLVAALAAGNRVVLKMSEFAPHLGETLRRVLADVFSEDQVAVINGGVPVAQEFASLHWDHLLFTGSTSVGKHVMRAAADNLTPVTLELGGKSPVIVAPDYPIEHAAERILYGKCLNAGQTCIAPDYVLLPESKVEQFVAAARTVVTRNYPNLAKNADYSNVVNMRHVERLHGYLRDAGEQGATVLPLALVPEGEQKIAPTIVLNVNDGMKIMQDEIFGPLLPVIPYRTIDDAVAFVNARPRPLALYCFDHNNARIAQVLSQTVSGGVGINETLMHFGQDDLPMGGVGPSGMGRYHGREGFETFSQMKPVFAQSRINSIGLMRPPYGKLFQFIVNLMLRLS